jgi:hypothetical protein
LRRSSSLWGPTGPGGPMRSSSAWPRARRLPPGSRWVRRPWW